ncbi:tol-pal system YbgF family protein [Calditrichota bacterium]
MKNIFFYTFVLIIFNAQFVMGESPVKIVKITGDVKVRFGLEENWNQAGKGMLLEDIDTILSGEGAQVTLETKEGGLFKLGGNSVLDVGDLRQIMEKELFLILMSDKIEKMEPRKEKTKLRVGNVSVVHGDSKSESKSDTLIEGQFNWFTREVNGAKALLTQKYFPNAILKMNKILSKYAPVKDCGKLYFYIGNAFEAINKPGQAIDAYQKSIEWCQSQNCDGSMDRARIVEAEQAIKKLKTLNK